MRPQRFLFCFPLEIGVLTGMVFNLILIPIGIGMSYLAIDKISKVNEMMEKFDGDVKIPVFAKEEMKVKDLFKHVTTTYTIIAVVYIIITISSLIGAVILLLGELKRNHILLSIWLGLMVMMGTCEMTLIHLQMTVTNFTDNWLAVWPFIFSTGIYLWTVVYSFRSGILEKTRGQMLGCQETTAFNQV